MFNQTGFSDISPAAIAIRYGLPIAVFLAVLLAPNPEGLTEQGQRALGSPSAAFPDDVQGDLLFAIIGEPR